MIYILIASAVLFYVAGFIHGRRSGYERAYFERDGDPNYMGPAYGPQDCVNSNHESKPEVNP